MTLTKPETQADLEPPFEMIGDEGWESRLRDLLNSYGVPIPNPVPAKEVDAAEATLGLQLPSSLRTFLTKIGPLDFGSMRVLSVKEISTLERIWFADSMPSQEKARIPQLVGVLDYLGTGDFIAWDSANDKFVLVGHDPPGIHPWLPTFDDCVREQCVDLAAGCYGWPDEEVELLVEDVKARLFQR